MPTQTAAHPELSSCGLPREHVHQPEWYRKKSSLELLRIARLETTSLDLESSCIGDLGTALRELTDASDLAKDGVGILLTCYAAVAECRCHVLHSALYQLEQREQARVQDRGA